LPFLALPFLALLTLTVLPLTTLPLSAQTVSTRDSGEPQLSNHFALELQRQAAYYTFEVPQPVYAASQRDDLGDVRVFNGAHERVPYSLEAPRKSEQPLVERPVRWFPVPAPAKGAAADGPLGLTIAPDGSLRLSPAQAQSANGRSSERTSDIVDTGSSTTAITALVISLNGIFQGRLTIEASDDLRSWRYVADTALLRLIFDGEILTQQRIPLGHLDARFLRLNWRDGAPEIAAMVAEEAGPIPVAAVPQRQWRDFDVRQGDVPGQYFFTTDGAYPLDLLRLQLPQTNTVARLQVWSRQNVKDSWQHRGQAQGSWQRRGQAQDLWQHRGQAVAYRLQSKGGEEQVSPPLAVERSADREWRIDVDMRGGGLGAGALKVAGGWHPNVLTFVARGEPPFSLGVGNDRLWSQAVSRDELMISAASNLAQAHLGAAIEPPQAVAAPPPPAPAPDTDASRRIILWVALTLAVGVLGLIAWTLARLPKPSEETDAKDAL